MDNFLVVQDELSRLINDQSKELYNRLQALDADGLGMPEHCLHYFKSSHFNRIFFSIQTSAALLYRAIKLTGKEPSSLVLMDYGAGVGTLYPLARMIGCGKVIYNDHLEDWKKSAELLATALNCPSDLYIVGDIEETLDVLDREGLQCDIIASRNVIEHIYRLDQFYKLLAVRQPGAILFSSTTANQKNPGTRFTHRRMHLKWEKVYRKQREEIIHQYHPGFTASEAATLAFQTRGLAKWDILKAADIYLTTRKLPEPMTVGTNTCDPENGVWVEHLLPFSYYISWITGAGYTASFEPGFWDTHNRKSWKNLIGFLCNPLIRSVPFLSFGLAPFIYVIARPSHKPQSRLSSQR